MCCWHRKTDSPLDLGHGQGWLGRSMESLVRIAFYSEVHVDVSISLTTLTSHCGPGFVTTVTSTVGWYSLHQNQGNTFLQTLKKAYLVSHDQEKTWNFGKTPSVERKWDKNFWLSMSHICTYTFPVLPYFSRTSGTDETWPIPTPFQSCSGGLLFFCNLEL